MCHFHSLNGSLYTVDDDYASDCDGDDFATAGGDCGGVGDGL